MSSRVCPVCREQVESEDLFCPRDGSRLMSSSTCGRQATEHEDPIVGKRVAGRYLVIRKLGEGGMGEVYLAEHEEIEKRLALKLLKREYADREDMVQRFRQEAISASRIKHPNVVEVFDFGQIEDGRFYLAMELLEGRDLADVLAAERRLAPYRTVRIALSICRALTAAHARGVVHRDMKPENVFLMNTMDGEELIKIVDFGIAQLRSVNSERAGREKRNLTRPGQIFGTPEYMAPEQAAGGETDKAVDVYATGVMLFEMLTGRVPFYGPTFMAVLAAHMTQPIPQLRQVDPKLRVSQELEAAIVRALAKEPRARFGSMAEFADALRATPEAGLDIPIPLMREHPQQDDEPPLAPVRRRRRSDRDDTEPAVASTQGLIEPRPRPRRVGMAVTIGLSAMVVGLAGGGFAYWRYEIRGAPLQVQPVAPPPTACASGPPAVSSSPIAGVSATIASGALVPTPAPSAEPIVIQVVTKPSGAVLKKREGTSLLQVCSQTPCDYPARLDERVEFVAEKPGLRGTGSVLARTSQSLEIILTSGQSPVPTMTSATVRPPPAPVPPCEGDDCLKNPLTGNK